jgi:hypothetical protein
MPLMSGKTGRVAFVETFCKLSIWLVAMLVFAVPAQAEMLLAPHTAQYKIKISIFGGILFTELRSSETGYVATHRIETRGMASLFSNGSISESSAFDIAADGVRPTNYISDDTLTKDKTQANIRFDWSTGEASGIVNGAAVVSQLDDIAFDRISIQYELMHDLLNGGPNTEYTLFEVDKLKTVVVTNIGPKQVSTPAGKFDAIGIQHQAVNSKRITTLWCVEELDFLPVIVEQHRKGKLQVRAALQKYTPESVQPPQESGQRY